MKPLAAALLCLLIAGCASPPPVATPSGSVGSSGPEASPTSLPSPTSGIAFTCPGFPGDGTAGPPASPGLDCSSAEAAVLAAAAGPGRVVKSVTIMQGGFFCGIPFAEGMLISCPRPNSGPAAYATFVGTDKVMALLIGMERGGSGGVLATVVVFEVPPAGWVMP